MRPLLTGRAAMVALAIIVLLRFTSFAAFSQSFTLTGPVVDPAGLLSSSAQKEIREASEAFRVATGRWLVLVALSDVTEIDLDPTGFNRTAAWEPDGVSRPIGIIYMTSPKPASGTLLLVDPDWRRVAPHPWIPMFPRRLAEKYGDEPFERRAVLSAQYLADVFPDKIAFLMQPPDVIPPESIEAAERIMTVVKWFVYFIILFTFFRTFWPARLKDEDTSAFSDELRALKKERQIW